RLRRKFRNRPTAGMTGRLTVFQIQSIVGESWFPSESLRLPIHPQVETTEMRTITNVFIITAALAGLALAGPALAGPALVRPITDRACAVHAKQEVLGCREECTGDFQNAKLLCRDIETECGLQCLGHRESCIETAVQPLQDCLGNCR